MPCLHRNTLAFIGHTSRDPILVQKVMKDKFIALSKKGDLTTWSIATGKLLEKHKIRDDINWKDFSIYQSDKDDFTHKNEFKNKVLLYNKTPIENYDEMQYWDPELMHKEISKILPYMLMQPKKFHEFKLVEVLNEMEIKVHSTFVHAVFEMEQKIYLSKNVKWMIERLGYSDVYLYQNVNNEEWRFHKHIISFPASEQAGQQFHLSQFSPNFDYFVQLDLATKQYQVKDMLTEEVKWTVPLDILNPLMSSPKSLMSRF